MTATIVRLAALILATGLAAALLHILLSLADGWASRSAVGKGAAMALLSIAVALPLELGVEAYWHVQTQAPPPPAIRAFAEAALCEEGARLLALWLLARMMLTRDPREFFLGVVTVGLGFGVVENVGYLQLSDSPLALGGLRGALSVLCHLSYALFGGLGVWRFRHERASPGFLGAMVGAAFLLHGGFDFAAMSLPDDEASASPPLSTAALLAFSALLVGVVLVQALAALATTDAFLSRIDNAPPHDAALAQRGPVSKFWPVLGAAMIAVAALAVVGVAVGFAIGAEQAASIAPVALALAASLGGWGVGMRHLAARQRENAREAGWASSATRWRYAPG